MIKVDEGKKETVREREREIDDDSDAPPIENINRVVSLSLSLTVSSCFLLLLSILSCHRECG